MKTINISQSVTVPDGVKCSVKARTVTVTGPRGKLVKSFRHLKVDISKVDKKTLKVEKWFGLHKELAAVRTICSHITNMFTGVTKVSSDRQGRKHTAVKVLVVRKRQLSSTRSLGLQDGRPL